MTEDILFDNLYIGHSLEDAKKLSEETYEVKKKIEEEVKTAEEKAEAAEAGDVQTVFKDDPVGFIRGKVLEFVELAMVDPVFAAKAKPEVAAGLGFVVLFFIGAFLSFTSGGSKPVAVSLNLAPHHGGQSPHRLSFTSHPGGPSLPHPPAQQPRLLPPRKLAPQGLAPRGLIGGLTPL